MKSGDLHRQDGVSRPAQTGWSQETYTDRMESGDLHIQVEVRRPIQIE